MSLRAPLLSFSHQSVPSGQDCMLLPGTGQEVGVSNAFF